MTEAREQMNTGNTLLQRNGCINAFKGIACEGLKTFLCMEVGYTVSDKKLNQ